MSSWNTLFIYRFSVALISTRAQKFITMPTLNLRNIFIALSSITKRFFNPHAMRIKHDLRAKKRLRDCKKFSKQRNLAWERMCAWRDCNYGWHAPVSAQLCFRLRYHRPVAFLQTNKIQHEFKILDLIKNSIKIRADLISVSIHTLRISNLNINT